MAVYAGPLNGGAHQFEQSGERSHSHQHYARGARREHTMSCWPHAAAVDQTTTALACTHTHSLTHAGAEPSKQSSATRVYRWAAGWLAGTQESYSAEPNLANPQVTHTNGKYFMQLRMHFVTSCRGKHAPRLQTLLGWLLTRKMSRALKHNNYIYLRCSERVRDLHLHLF